MPCSSALVVLALISGSLAECCQRVLRIRHSFDFSDGMLSDFLPKYAQIDGTGQVKKGLECSLLSRCHCDLGFCRVG